MSRAFLFSSITSSGCYEKSCAVIDRAYSRRRFKVNHYPVTGLIRAGEEHCAKISGVFNTIGAQRETSSTYRVFQFC